MSEPLFQNTDEEERRYVGEPRADEQPTQPPRIPSPAFEHGTLTTPPLRADRDGTLSSEPIDQGALGDNRTSAAPHLTYVDTDTDEEGEQ